MMPYGVGKLRQVNFHTISILLVIVILLHIESMLRILSEWQICNRTGQMCNRTGLKYHSDLYGLINDLLKSASVSFSVTMLSWFAYFSNNLVHSHSGWQTLFLGQMIMEVSVACKWADSNHEATRLEHCSILVACAWCDGALSSSAPDDKGQIRCPHWGVIVSW